MNAQLLRDIRAGLRRAIADIKVLEECNRDPKTGRVTDCYDQDMTDALRQERQRYQEALKQLQGATVASRVRTEVCPSCLGTGGIGHCNKCNASGRIRKRKA